MKTINFFPVFFLNFFRLWLTSHEQANINWIEKHKAGLSKSEYPLKRTTESAKEKDGEPTKNKPTFNFFKGKEENSSKSIAMKKKALSK